jgi:streptomycin 6-kinase
VTTRDDVGLPNEVELRLAAWALERDGALITTRSSWVLPVRQGETPAMLKIARIPDERCGYELMRWWDGEGAAKVLLGGGDALLLERAVSGRDLAQMSWGGADDEACLKLCDVAARLHTDRRGPWPELHPLGRWFQPLFDLAPQHHALAAAAAVARGLLEDPRDLRPLHGDLHHENVLDFGARGWLAIDPHGLVGERAFDLANVFTNPDLGDPSRAVATLPGRFETRLAIVTAATGLAAERLLRWIVAWTGLSAAWFLSDGDDSGMAIDLAINQQAASLLELVA